MREVFRLFARLAERRDQLAGTMSGGEQQMLAVGRALMGRPRLLMLDEPSLGLAPKMLDELLAMVRRICDEGVTVLLVEQNVAKALAIAEDAYVIERGRVVLQGPAREVLQSGHLREAYLGAHAGKGIKSRRKETIFMSKEQTTAVTIAAENAWKGKVFTGTWTVPKGGTREVIEPATGKVLTTVGWADAEDVRAAAKAAAAAQVEWAATPPDQRAAVIRRAAQLLEAHADALRPWIVRETGGIPPKADFEIHFVTNILHRSGGDRHPAPGPDAAEQREAHELRAARAARRGRRDLAVQFPADPVGARGRAGARARATRCCSSPIRRRRSPAASSSRGCSRRRACRRACCRCCRAARLRARR